MIKIFLFMVFFFFLLVLLMGFSIIRTIKNVLFGRGDGGRREEPRRRQASRPSEPRSEQRYNRFEEEEYHPHAPHRKIFSKDEGEYVDYEEVK